MAVSLETETANTLRKRYRHQQPGDPNVEVNLSVNQEANTASIQIRINGATGANQLKQVLQLIIQKISSDFNV